MFTLKAPSLLFITASLLGLSGCGLHVHSASEWAQESEPSLTCGVTPSAVSAGAQAMIQASARDPAGLPLTYSYVSSRGTLQNKGTSAILSTAGLASGDVSITCTAVDTAGNTSTSSADLQVLPAATSTPVLAAASISVSVSPNPAAFGTAIGVVVDLTGGAGVPSGAITLMDGSVPIVTQVIDANGFVQYQDASLAAGQHTLTALYTGDAHYQPGQSGAFLLSISAPPASAPPTPAPPAPVQPAPPAPVQPAPPAPVQPAPPAPVQPAPPTPVQPAPPAPVQPAPPTPVQPAPPTPVQPTPPTPVQPTPVQPSPPSTPVVPSPTAPSATTTTLVTPSGPLVAGQSALLTAKVQASNATPIGTLNFADGGKVVATASLVKGNASFTLKNLTAGRHLLTAVFAGNSMFASSMSAPDALQVNVVVPPPTLSCSATPLSVMQGDAVQLAAVGSSSAGLPLTYSFSAPSGVIKNSGSTAVWQTATASIGINSLTCVVEDSGGRSSNINVAVNIVAPGKGERAAAADSFVNAVGVNVHFGVLDTPYTDRTQAMISALHAAGIRHVRDSLFDDDWFGSETYYSVHNQLAALGIKTDYITSIGQSVAEIQAYPMRVKDMEAIEAPNEQDNRNDPAWQGELTAYLPVLEEAVHGNKPMSGITVVGPSFVNQSSFYAVGNISRWMDVSNLHNYLGGYNPGTPGWGPPDAEANLYGSIPWAIDEAHVDGPHESIWTTETGYQTIPNQPGSVSEAVGGMYAPRVLLEQWNAGIQRSYFYELADEAGTPMWGLLHQDGSPKPSYTAVASTLNLLTDPGVAFVPGSLNFQLGGQVDNVHHLLLQKRDNSFWMALWVELPNWDVNQPWVIPPSSPQAVSLDLGNDAEITGLYSLNLDGTLTHSTPALLHTANLSLTGLVTFVRVSLSLNQ